MDKTQEEIYTEFKQRKKKLVIFHFIFFPILFGLVFLLKIEWLKENIAFFIIPFSLYIIVAVCFAQMIWRCPSCKQPLGKLWKPRFCPQCGIPLIKNNKTPNNSNSGD